MAMREYQAYGSLLADSYSYRPSLQIGLRVGGHLAVTDFHSCDPRELLRDFAIDDSVINIFIHIRTKVAQRAFSISGRTADWNSILTSTHRDWLHLSDK